MLRHRRGKAEQFFNATADRLRIRRKLPANLRVLRKVVEDECPAVGRGVQARQNQHDDQTHPLGPGDRTALDLKSEQIAG
ncbi:hypothetical protein Psuf_059460 [Phytohabitans suffuscus]|uniref:Uncharacterized protein n=1 Tax=Phytohabitans suffuscus TaxID=624315 RepID=A0A6F8YRL4_9ACTN|nr:hypothetical protein Psuf_059460 [Phytohabitans suffuscus]